MGEPPTAPYPPDLDEDAAPVAELGDLVDAVAVDREWANLRARGLAARRVEVRRSRLTGTELAEAALTDVTFSDCRLDLVGLRMATLQRVVFRDCRMAECDLYDASLTDVLFERCELREATLSGARLERVELRGCDLAGLRGVEALRGARMPWNDVLENATLFAVALGVRSSTDRRDGQAQTRAGERGRCLRDGVAVPCDRVRRSVGGSPGRGKVVADRGHGRACGRRS